MDLAKNYVTHSHNNGMIFCFMCRSDRLTSVLYAVCIDHQSTWALLHQTKSLNPTVEDPSSHSRPQLKAKALSGQHRRRVMCKADSVCRKEVSIGCAAKKKNIRNATIHKSVPISGINAEQLDKEVFRSYHTMERERKKRGHPTL